MRTMREIRKELGFSYGTMAKSLGLEKATYQGYDTGRSPTPRAVMLEALKVLRRNRNFWRSMPKRIDANLKNGICPNDARPLPGSKLLTTGRYYEADL
jgi:transcriptional regulator with XRE-family HTH domain